MNVRPIEDCLLALQQAQVKIWAEGDKLRFKAPAGALTDDLKAEVSSRKAEILQTLQRRALFERDIPRLPAGEPALPSLAQQRLLFLEQLEDQQALYNIPAVFHVKGRLEAQTLRNSLTALVARHESLRACFPNTGGQVLACVREVYDPLRVSDLSHLHGEAQQTRIDALLAEHAHQHFDLETGPLLSLHLLELGDERQILAFNTHHIISDGWSVGVMVREWQAIYDALAAGSEPALAPLPIQFNDYAAWQRQWLEQGVLQSQLDYWRRELQGLPALLELPTDFPRPQLMGFQGSHLHFSLSADLSRRVAAFSQAQGATPFMTLLAVFNVLLHRWSGQDDLSVGSPIANRTHPQTEGLLGFFVNTLVLRSRLNERLSFREYVAQVRHTALGAYAQQDLPFDYLVEQLNPTRSMGHSPLFQVMFALQNAHQESLSLGGAQLELLKPAHDIAKFDLSLSVGEQDGLLHCDWEFRTDLFRPETIERMAGHFEQLLGAALDHADTLVGELPMLTAADIQWLHAHSGNPLALPADQTIVDLFEAQAALRPDHVALVFGEQRWTYAQLNARANQWAAHLMARGAGPEHFVGLCVERSPEMIMGLLAILKAGAAYLPLDPEYPQDRLEFMLADAGVKILLTQSHLAQRLPTRDGVGVCCMDGMALEEISSANPARRAGPENLAYVIYTSGSTGQPKGVLMAHAALANYVQGISQHYGLTPADRVLQFSSINFDASVEEIHATLATGATLVLRGKDMLSTEQDFLNACGQLGVTVFPGPTAYWHQLVSADVKWPSSLRLVIFGGEAVSQRHVQLWQEKKYSQARLLNSYGPTEATVAATAYFIDQPLERACPIGKPLANTRIHVLDAQLKPVAPGIAGELCIAGAGLARGYLNRPELTAEKFVDVEILGRRERIYRSGDLARWLPDGNLEYLGRLDQQVKLRGFRIELGEIETALARHPAVGEAVVTLHEREGEKFLAAYVTAQAGAAAAMPANLADELRTQLRQSLPQWMVPASFNVLEKLPLNPNGKVDRKALPAPDMVSQSSTATLVPPQNTLERQIAEVWAKVLKLQRVGTQDNFFDLGGHSLLLLQVLGQLREKLALPLQVVTLFQFPTIQSLAAHLAQGQAAEKPAAPAATETTPKAENPADGGGDDIAIIGMAGQFPGADNIEQFWSNLRAGVESIRSFSDEELLASGVPPEIFNRPDYVRAGGVLEKPEYFDAAFFGYPPAEAELLDPQQRLFMETAWTALEHAGYDVGRMPFSVGLFAGAGTSTYFLNNLWPNQALLAQFGQQQVVMGGDKDFVAARTAYKLNLRGPALSISTACSTSLVAVHMARQSLLAGECRMALAGGVTVFFPQKQGYVYQPGMILSPDGHCRAFDADAQGSVGGAGVATVVLKRLKHALEDGDTIHAVIKNSAINNDGMGRIGFTAPSVEGQSRVVSEAMRGLDFESIGYIETHGTGTLLGDPIEISALNQAYKPHTSKAGYCALGSVKTNIGHLDTAAGVTGLIKAVLALRHGEIPPTLHFKKPNPQIDFEGSPFFVNAELRPWVSDAPRRAGVSSFGIGGTNAHVILEEAPAPVSSEGRPWQLLGLSARTEGALKQYRADLAAFLRQHPGVNLADLAYTLQVGRGAFAHRGFVVGRDAEDIAAQLGADKSRHWQRGRVGEQPARVAFLFPGQGSQYANMGLGLYQQEPVFRAALDECAELLRPHLQLDLRELIYPADAAAVELKGSQAAQPALFAVEYALARLCLHWGLEPVAMMGHSIGEYVAACLAGVFTLPDALQLVAIRGALMQTVPQGEMLGILLPADEVKALLPAGVHIAAHNAPKLTSVSGSPQAMGAFAETLKERRIFFSRLQTLNAAHSPVMAPVLPAFREALAQIRLNAPTRPFVSNLTGTWITAEQATSPDYWCQHLLQPVQFSKGLQALVEGGADVLLEVGPDMALTSFAQQHKPDLKLTALNLLRAASAQQDDCAWVLNTLGQLWLNHVAVDWARIHGDEQRQRVPAPTYPFERQRYWIEPLPRPGAQPVGQAMACSASAPAAPTQAGSASGNRPDLGVEFVAPETATQKTLAGLLEQLLGVRPIGLHDHFFHLGGNSLLGAQVLSRLREAFALEIPLNALFQHPVVEDLAAWLDAQQGDESMPTLAPIPAQAAGEPLVMSFSQQRLRFLAQLEGDSATYNLPGVVHLAGELNVQALRDAFRQLVERHDSLRLSFPIADGQPGVAKGGVYDPVEIENVCDLPAGEQIEYRQAWTARHAQSPFNLSTGPLLRVHVLVLNAREHVLMVNMHHIISDGWTIGLFIHEWSQLYNAALRHEPAPLAPLPIQYTDYSAWQRQWLQGEVLDRQTDYWKSKLTGAPALLELPTDFPRPAVTHYEGAHQRLAVPAELARALGEFSQAHGATLFMTLLAAFKVLLYRHSGQADVAVGTPVANRPRRELENLIGFFVNTLVLRDRLDEEGDFLTLLAQVRQTELEAHEHQDIPFDYLVEQLNPARSLSHSPLFQVMFAVQNAPAHGLALDGLSSTLLESDVRTSKFDLTLSVEERGGALACDWEYSTALFRGETIARLHGHWLVLLQAVLRDPAQPIARLPLLTPAEIQQLDAWNDTATGYPRDATLAALFEQQAAARAGHPALEFGGQCLSYAELNARANQLAHRLVALGVAADTPVAVCAERSADMVVGLLATLKAGGAYVPLDLDYPAERLALMLRDCGAPVLLSQRPLQGRWADFGGTVLALDDAALYEGLPTANLAPRATPDSLACVFYTSGSTGTPKGVCLRQSCVVNLVKQSTYQRFHGGLRMAQASNTSFDAATYEIWGALLNGGTLVHLPKGVLLHTAGLGAFLRERAISSMVLTTALFNQVAQQQPDAFGSLQELIFGGEQVDVPSVARVLAATPPRRLLQVYGPTETTTFSTWDEIRPPAAGQALQAFIGRPIGNTRIHILSPHGQVLPVGVAGELCIAGDGVARGYLNRPELTAEKFAEVDIFGRRERVYRSGDLARRLPDGNLDFLGRMDGQVKLRGLRIELGEIEAALATHPGVAQAVVMVRGQADHRFLAAWLLAEAGHEPAAPGALKAHLRASLPEWMVPASFTWLECFPLTPNGKVDRKALPEPAAVESAQAVAPRTETETLLAGLYAAVLKAEVRDAGAHFFELGGHSLLATKLVSRIREAFGVDMALRTLFEFPVLSQLAAWLEGQRRGAALPPITPLAEGEPLALSPSQERLWFLSRLEGPSATYNVPGAVRFAGALDVAALRQAFALLVQRHQSLRMCFPEVDGAATVQLLPAYDPLSVCDLSALDADAREAALQRRLRGHAIEIFDLATGPLLRLELLALGGDEYVLLLNMHHIVSDGWSMAVLLREAGEHYAALAAGESPALQPLPVQYADYAAWQRRQGAGEAAQARLGWWLEHLAGAPTLLELPTDHPRPALQSFRGAALQTRVEPALAQALGELSRRHGATLYMTLLSAFGVLLMRHSGQDDVVVGSPSANRTQGATEQLIGFFVNTLALRLRGEPDMSFAALLAQVRRTALEAFARQDVPFETLVERLRPARSLSHSPLFQVMFVLQNNEDAAVRLPGLACEALALEVPTAKFDLTLSAREHGGGLALDWEYAADLFEPATVQALAGRFNELLQGIVAAPEQDLRRLPLLTAAETAQIAAWNGTAAPVTARLLHAPFLRMAAAAPRRVAVVAHDRVLNYAELHHEALALAHRLRALGVQRNQLVAVLMDKGWQQVVAVMGVLMAGGAYLPMDPELPAQRRNYLLTQGGVAVALTQPHVDTAEDWPDAVRRLDVLPIAGSLAADPLPPLDVAQGPQDLAYVIYTSGSTGLPKGVAIDHRGAVNTVLDINRRFAVTAEDRVLSLSALNFDLSVYDLFGPLGVGGCVVLPAPDARREPAHWAQALQRHGVTLWNTVPALMQMLVDHQAGHALAAPLRLVMMSGDWIPLDLPARIRNLWPAAELVSLGGATEASIWSIWYPIGEVDPAWKSIPYGKPLDNQSFFVLNEALEPCPMGTPGQLYIGGIGLALGYWRDKEKTDAAFIVHPRTGERLYRTGDLGRWLADGNIEFLGRADTQVKIRGHRIELGEIEAALLRHQSVAEAVVVVREHQGSPLLAAYVTPAGALPASEGLAPLLRDHLKLSLPDYMVPASFTLLERLPLSTNGKVDRKALPAPELAQAGRIQPPRTPTEELLCTLWSQTLKAEVLDVQSNFFETGGHSLLATQLVSRLREAFNTPMALQVVFELPVLTQQAQWLEQQQRGESQDQGQDRGIRPLQPGEPLVLSFAQQRLWFLSHLEGQTAAYNIPVALRLRGALDPAALRASMRALVARHESLRLCFPGVNGAGTVARLPAYDPVRTLDLQHLDAHQQEAQLQQRLAEYGQAAFDLDHGPLFSLQVLQLAPQDHVLLFNMHHVISDGWSMGVLVRDWRELYQAALESREPALPALSIQYTDFAAWQKGWLQGEALKTQLAYWQSQLAGAPELLDLPADFARPAVKTYLGRRLESVLPAPLSAGLHRLSREHGATPFMALLAAFKVLLYRYSGQADVLVGSPIANRTQRQTEDLLGFFVNTLVMRSSLGAEQTFAELLKQVRQTALQAYAHQDIPFEYLVEQLNPHRSLSYSPLFQVMFILQNAPLDALEFEGLTVENLAPALDSAKFDLTLSMAERDGQFICDWEYSTDLFEEETIRRMAGHFEVLLTKLLQAPQQPYAQFSLVTPAEAQEIQAWNRTDFAYPQHQTLVDVFETQAAAHPGRIAACFGDDAWTFAQLNARANQVAHHLVNLGVGPDTLVGICVERSLDMLAGLLGILKAGGAYVPMDPEYPRERLQMMVEDSGIPVLLTQRRLVQALPPSTATVVCLDGDDAALETRGTDNPPRRSAPENLAYVIFTSGSTGRPKGVMIEHGPLLNFLTYMGQRLNIQAQDKFLALTTLSFDIAGLELYLPLASGAQVALISRETAMDGQLLMAEMERRGITLMQATPATWKLLLQSGWQQQTPLTILCGGEAMPSELGKKLLENSRQLWNVYGPTETTIWSSMQNVTQTPGRPQLIGHPIGNTQIYILDNQNNMVPPGMPGELCIGGRGLSRGYLNRADLTAEKFVEVDVLGEKIKLYRTGDLARHLRNGTLECLGRVDHQVKIRGFRIELGEVEEALNQHPRVRESAVITDAARENLLAYVVPQAAAEPTKESGQDEAVKHWEQVWSDAYAQSSDDLEDGQRNDIGWNSSYTLEPIPSKEMKEWLTCTIENVLALAPKRILEIGCGTGMLLFRLAPHCEHYTGVDISPQALAWIARQKQGWEFGDRVSLQQAAADQITGVEPGSVDLVIINSVIQYFPSVDYLVQVLRQAAALVAPGGRIFVGDVRNFRLMEAFHASIQWFQAEAGLPLPELQQRVAAALGRERELLIDPDFFTALQREIPAIGRVDIRLKHGAAHNEMTRFRYDATLQLGAAREETVIPVQRLDWREDGLTLEKLGPLLAGTTADALEIHHIPNARLDEEKQLLAQLSSFPGTVAAFKLLLARQDGGGVDPETLRQMAAGSAWNCRLHEADGFTFTAVWQRAGTGETCFHSPAGRTVAAGRNWRTFANTPALDMLDKAAFVGELREYLQQRLPAYMLPGSFTLLDKLPLTPNGKIDRKSLPEPDAQRRDKVYCPPRDTLEFELARLWEDLLQVRPVGVHDHFFELGGHSLLAVRLVAQIEQKFGQRISLATLFHNTTIEALARVLRQQGENLPWSCLVPIQAAGNSTPLFLVHPAGGNVLCYMALARELGSDQPVYAFQAQGLEDGQIPMAEVADMARAYIAAMKTVQPQGPYKLAGWSFGGVVAVEMAAQLQARGESTHFIGLLDAIAPHVIRELESQTEDDAEFFANYFAESGAELSVENLRRLSSEEQLTFVAEQGRQQGIFPTDLEIPQLKRLVKTYRANMSAALRHHAGLVDTGLTLFQATERRPEDPVLPAEHGWQLHATQAVEVIQVPGAHHTMVNSPHVQTLAEHLKTLLARKTRTRPALETGEALA